MKIIFRNLVRISISCYYFVLQDSMQIIPSTQKLSPTTSILQQVYHSLIQKYCGKYYFTARLKVLTTFVFGNLGAFAIIHVGAFHLDHVAE